MKTRTIARCRSCGAHAPKWVGRCAECGEWGSVVEEQVSGTGRPAPVGVIRPRSLSGGPADERVPTGIEEFDRVLGGGFVRGSVVLLAGEPGVGKSTLTLQIAAALGRAEPVLLVCGEESAQQVGSRADRLGGIPEGIEALESTDLSAIVSALATAPGVVVVDSIQTVYDPEVASAPGSVSQVRDCGAKLARAARDARTTLVLVGHVTKDGSIAGPRVLEHLVDVVLTFDGDSQGGLRVLRALKNRFGSTHEAGFFEMTGSGLVGLSDASRYLLQDRAPGLAGSVLCAAVEGRRPVVLEVQALVAKTSITMPRRSALGVDGARLPLIVAVLERRLGLPLGDHDVYVSAVGGIRAAEPAADLPVVLAMLSAFRDVPLPDGMVAFGEVGLAGEVRQVAASDRRLAEARAVGCTTAVVPHNLDARADGIGLVRVRHLRDALQLVR